MNIETLALIVLITIIVFIYFSVNRISNSQLNEYIINHFENEEFEIVNIRNLNIREKIHYNEFSSLSSLFYFGNHFIFSNSEKYYRVVELIDKKGVEIQKYIEIQLSNRMLVGITIFDNYEY